MKKLLCLICLLLVPPLTVRAESQREIRIGLLTDLSGVGSYYGLRSEVGARMAVEELQQRGAKVRLFVEDSALKTTQAVSAAQKLLMSDKVDVIYADFSAVSIAISPLVKAQRKLLFYSAAARSVIDSNPYAFKTYSDYIDGCAALTREFLRQGVKRVAVLRADLEFGELCLSGARQVLPEVLEYSYKPGDLVNSQILALKTKGVEAVLNASYESEILNMLQAMRALKFYARIGSVEDGVSDLVRREYPAELEGALIFGLKAPPVEFLARAKQASGGKLSNLENAALFYYHTFQVHAALAACAADNLECVVQKLAVAKPQPEIGFNGFKNRVAKLEMPLRQFVKGQFVKP